MLRGRIESGEWRRGTPIPGEADLSRELGVSVGTVRKALDQLARDRIIVRERGRGTFIKDENPGWPGPGIGPAFRLCETDGRPLVPLIKLIDVAAGRPLANEAQTLRIMRQTSIATSVIRVRREWLCGGRPVCLETITVDEARFPRLAGMLSEATGETLFHLYAEAFRTQVDRTVWSFRAIPGTDPVHQRLAAGDGLPLMQCRRIAFDVKDMPIEVADQVLALHGECYQVVR